jgi:hypothetical protein
MPSSKVPAHRIKIKAIRPNIFVRTKVAPWLGLQGGEYLSLPVDWVSLNFEESLLKEGTERAERALQGKLITSHRFLPLPVEDYRDDDPPLILRDNQGLNYYYQGQVNNCVMGRLANVVFWMRGPKLPDALLNGFTPNISEFWFGWVKHVHSALKEYLLKKHKCPDILKMEDSSPVVFQL